MNNHKLPAACSVVGLLATALVAILALLYSSGVWANLPVSQFPNGPSRTPEPPAAILSPLVSTPLRRDTPTPFSTPLAEPGATPMTDPTAPATAGPVALYPREVDETQIEAILSQMSLEQKIGQMLMVGLPAGYMDETAYRRVAQQGVGGVIFLERNAENPQQVAAFTTALQAAAMGQGARLPLFIGWNHEGGPVVRANAQVTAFPSAMALGVANQPALVYQVGQAVGREMRSLGVNVNFAPVLDVNSDMANPVIGLRSYGANPALVAAMGQQYIGGQQSAGIIAVAKHFPGHGGVDVDSHVDLPLLDAPADLLYSRDLPPFWTAVDAGVGGMMVAHLQIPALEPDGWPASLSPRIVDGILRQQMGYDGVVMTDDMGMGAIINHYSLEEAAIQAVLAGNDLLLTVETDNYPDRMRAALLNAVSTGRILPERIDRAVRRLIRLKLAYELGLAPTTPPLAEQQAHLQLAGQAAGAAVSVLQDDAGWLPLQLPNRSILLITPTTTHAGAVAGNGLSLLGELLAARGLTVTEQFYIPDAPWSVAQAQSEALALAPNVDATVMLTANAILRHAHNQEVAQEALVNALQASGSPVVVVFSQLPYDQQRVPQAPVQIATYGDTAAQLEALVALLVGISQ